MWQQKESKRKIERKQEEAKVREEQESVQMIKGGNQDRMLIQDLKPITYTFSEIEDNILQFNYI